MLPHSENIIDVVVGESGDEDVGLLLKGAILSLLLHTHIKLYELIDAKMSNVPLTLCDLAT